MPRWLLPYYEGLNVPGKEGKNVKAFTLNTMEKGGEVLEPFALPTIFSKKSGKQEIFVILNL